MLGFAPPTAWRRDAGRTLRRRAREFLQSLAAPVPPISPITQAQGNSVTSGISTAPYLVHEFASENWVALHPSCLRSTWRQQAQLRRLSSSNFPLFSIPDVATLCQSAEDRRCAR